MKLRELCLLIVISLSVSSCSVTRRMQDDQYLLTRNRISIRYDQELSRSDRIDKDRLSDYIRQRPNKRFLGVPFFLHLYNLYPAERENWTKRAGEAPVIYDPEQTERSAGSLSIYMREHGFFDSSVEARVDTVRNHKIRVKYRITAGMPTKIGTVQYEFQDAFVEPIIRQDSAETLIHPGDVYNMETLQAERQRVTTRLKNLGFFNFSINNIGFVADTVSRPGYVNLVMRVRQRAAGFDEQDRPVLENNKVYRIRNLYIQPDYNAGWASRDSLYFTRLDTLEYRGMNFIYFRRLNVRADVLSQAVNIYPNDLYSAEQVSRAYDNLMRLNVFQTTSIVFEELPDTLSGMVTFIGQEGESENFTREGFLDCRIRCTPGKNQSYSVDLEGAGTSTYYGLVTTLGYQNRNLLRGAESIDFSITTGYELMRSQGRKNSLELGGAVGITFPRFIAPFKIDSYNRANQPRTRFEISYSYQDRPYYTRALISGNWGYSWRNKGYSSFILRPLDVSIVKARNVDQDFLDDLRNDYLRSSFANQLIAGISGSYIYNNQTKNPYGNSFRLRWNAESNGNLLNLLAPLILNKSEEHYKFFGIRFAQFVRTDLDLSYKFALGTKTAIASRFYIGAGQTYGNSSNSSIPFERQFYSGGPNSMRGWQARTLGPGSRLANEYREAELDPEGNPVEKTNYPAQVGNFKLEGNVEFRFPVYKFLNGALFADLGNIWLIGSRLENTESQEYFKFNRFYDQLGLNTGLGTRFDFGFFMFRLDWGLKLHNPNRPAGEKWIGRLTMRQSTINFNVGYPF